LQNSPPMHQEPYKDSPPMLLDEVPAHAGAENSRSVSPIGPEDERPRSQPFNFGFGGVNDGRQQKVSSSYDTGSSSMHPGLRAEKPSERSRSIDTQSQYRPSEDTASRYDRPSSEYPESNYHRKSEVPSLGPIQGVGHIDLPSRFNSQYSANHSNDISDTTGGQDWLRAVDNLDWNHDRSAPAPAPAAVYKQPSTSARGFPTPNLPRRSSRRTPSQDLTPTLHSLEHSQGDVFAGFDSGHTSPDFLTAPAHDERPTSFTSVGHHRAADSVTRNSFGANAAMHGATAEILGRDSGESGGYSQNR